MRAAALGMALLLLAGTARAECGFTTEEKVMLGVFYGLLLADRNQTRNAMRSGNAVETNPFIGRHPTPETIDAWALGIGSFMAVAACQTSGQVRSFLLGFIIGAEFAAVRTNAAVGFSAGF